MLGWVLPVTSSIPLRLTPFPKCQKARAAYSGGNAGKAPKRYSSLQQKSQAVPMDKLTHR